MGRKKYSPFDVDDRLKLAEKKYDRWIIVKTDEKIAAYNKDDGKRIISKPTVGGMTSLENQIEAHNSNQ